MANKSLKAKHVDLRPSWFEESVNITLRGKTPSTNYQHLLLVVMLSNIIQHTLTG